MPIIYIIIGLAAVAFVLWLVNEKIPMPSMYRTAINWIVLILLVWWFLDKTGLLSSILSIRV